MADRIVVLRDGRVEQVGRPLDLYNEPANRFVAGFIGAPRMNFLDGRLLEDDAGTRIVLDCGYELSIRHSASLGAETPINVGIRPEAIEVSLEGAGDLPVTVENFEQLGAITYIYTRLSSDERLTVQLPWQVPLERGQIIHATLPRSNIHLFGADERKIAFS